MAFPEEAARLSFGLVPPASSLPGPDRLGELVDLLGERTGLVIARRQVASYDDLARLLRAGVLQLAWLPPILFAHLGTEGVVREVASADRGEAEPSLSVLIAKRGRGLRSAEDLRGLSVGWVDPLSAAGYVVPRLRLASAGLPPDTLFARERVFGSHAAVVRAVLDGTIDVGATYAALGRDGELSRGAFLELGAPADALEIALGFGPIPADVIAVHATVPPAVSDRLAAALLAEDAPLRELLFQTFGAKRLVRGPLVGHDLLRSEIARAPEVLVPAAHAFVGRPK